MKNVRRILLLSVSGALVAVFFPAPVERHQVANETYDRAGPADDAEREGTVLALLSSVAVSSGARPKQAYLAEALDLMGN